MNEECSGFRNPWKGFNGLWCKGNELMFLFYKNKTSLCYFYFMMPRFLPSHSWHYIGASSLKQRPYCPFECFLLCPYMFTDGGSEAKEYTVCLFTSKIIWNSRCKWSSLFSIERAGRLVLLSPSYQQKCSDLKQPQTNYISFNTLRRRF